MLQKLAKSMTEDDVRSAGGKEGKGEEGKVMKDGMREREGGKAGIKK